MKKIVLASSLSCMSLFGLQVEFNKEFNTFVQPNELQSTLNITSQHIKEKEALNSLNKYNNIIKKFSAIEKKESSISVYPQFEYIDNQSTFKHYNARLYHTLIFKNSNDVKEFFEKVYEVKENSSDKAQISIAALQWSVNPKIVAQEQEKLQLKAIQWSLNYVKTLSDNIDKKCEVSHLNFTNSFQNRPIMLRSDMAANQKSESLNMPILDKTQQEIKLNTHIQVSCQ